MLGSVSSKSKKSPPDVSQAGAFLARSERFDGRDNEIGSRAKPVRDRRGRQPPKFLPRGARSNVVTECALHRRKAGHLCQDVLLVFEFIHLRFYFGIAFVLKNAERNFEPLVNCAKNARALRTITFLTRK